MNAFRRSLVQTISIAPVLLAFGGTAQAQHTDWYDRYYGYYEDYSGYWDYDDYAGFDYNYWDDYSGYADYDDFGWNAATFEERSYYEPGEFGFEDYEAPYRTQEYYEALYTRPLYGYGPYDPAWETERRAGPPRSRQAREFAPYERRSRRNDGVERWH